MKNKAPKKQQTKEKTPYTYKRIQAKNLPFTYANRTLLSDPIFYQVLNTTGFKWVPGENRLTSEVTNDPNQLGFIDIETTLFILIKEIAMMKKEISEMRERL